MEDLRRRDFSLNAIAISLNPASRGLLLDPTNGLSDIERAEVRALTIHSFTNQPVRLLRSLRYGARMGFKLEQRTEEWFALAMERDLHHSITPEDAGAELQALAKEENPTDALKAWEEHDLMEVANPVLAKKKPDYEAIRRLSNVRDDLMEDIVERQAAKQEFRVRLPIAAMNEDTLDRLEKLFAGAPGMSQVVFELEAPDGTVVVVASQQRVKASPELTEAVRGLHKEAAAVAGSA